MAGKRRADDDIPGASQPPLGTTATPPDDDGDYPDPELALVLGLPGASGSATEQRTGVEPSAPQPRPTAGRSGEHDETAADRRSRLHLPTLERSSWTKGGSAMGPDLPPPSQWNYNMPPPQHLQSPQQYQMFLQGHTGPQVPPQHAIPGFVSPPSLVTGNAQQPQTAPAWASNQLAGPGQMRQQHGRSIIPRDDAQQRSARMLEVTARRELQQPEKRQKLEQEQATMSAPQLKLSLGPPGAAAQAQEQATMSARQEKLRLGQHAPAAQAPVPVNQSVAASRGLALPQPQRRRVLDCPACRARPALVVLDPVCHVCLCMYCFRDPSKACRVCRPG